jgi:hypothetical protein
MRDGFQELSMSIPRSREQRVKPIFDRALSGHTRLVGVGVRDKQRTGRDDRQRRDGDGGTFSRRPPAVTTFLGPGPSGWHRTQRLDGPVVRVLAGGERNDEQPAHREAHELLVRQVRDGDRELPGGPHGHARDGCVVVRRREFRHAHRGQRRVLVEREFALVGPCGCGCGCEDVALELALSLGFCLGEDPTTNRMG